MPTAQLAETAMHALTSICPGHISEAAAGGNDLLFNRQEIAAEARWCDHELV
jgi:RNA 3'-terminal phosphate cyclase